MLRVRDIMTEDVLTLSAQQSLREAMDFFASKHLSGAPVVAGRTVVGVISTTDLLEFVSAVDSLTSEAPADDAMLPDPGDEPSAIDSLALRSSIAEELWTEQADESTPVVAQHRTLDDHTVEEVMTRNLLALPGSASAREAAEMMRAHGVHRILVVEDGELVGIVSALDIANAVAGNEFRVRTYVFPR
jgi:CBS domain-containing protein